MITAIVPKPTGYQIMGNILVAAVIILLKVLLPEGASVSTPVHLPLIIILAVLFFAVVVIVSLAISLKVMENKEF